MSHDHSHRPHVTAADWDDRYRGDNDDRLWSGEPNGALVDEVSGLAPGRALDLGCGEGADAIWLAQQGWTVTAVDISNVALDRAAQAARDGGVDVVWRCADFVAVPPEAGEFDLVTTHYPALPATSMEPAIAALTVGVAPGGTLLFVGHLPDPVIMAEHGFDPDDYVQPGDLVKRLGVEWVVEVDETRPRTSAGSEGQQHTRDVIVRARRIDRERT